MVYCSPVGCNNDPRYVNKKHNVTYHHFPTDNPSLLEEWLAKVSHKDIVITKDSVVCSKHFEDDCIERDLTAELLGLEPRKVLKLDAVPTKLDHRPRKKPKRR